MIFVFLILTYFTLYDNLQVNPQQIQINERTESTKINPSMWDLNFLTRDPPHAPCSDSTESELLNCQGKLPNNILNSTLVFGLCLQLILKKTGNTVPIQVLIIAEEDFTQLLLCFHFQSCFFGIKEVNGSEKKKKGPLSSEKTIKPSLKMVPILKNFGQVEPLCEEWKLFKCLSLSFPVITPSF